MGQLLTQPIEELLPHDLGDHHRLGLIGDHAFRVVAGALGKPGYQFVEQCRHPLTGEGGNRENMGERPFRGLDELGN